MCPIPSISIMRKLFCRWNLQVEQVSRDENTRAKELSRLDDSNDYMLDPACFNYIKALCGLHTTDRFASLKTKQLERYCRRYYNPGCMAADAVMVSWSCDVNLAFFSSVPGSTCVEAHVSRKGE